MARVSVVVKASLATVVALCVYGPCWRARADDRSELTIWLMLNEPASKKPIDDFPNSIAAFNAAWRQQGIIVLNTTDDSLKDDLLSLYREFAASELKAIFGQKRTLGALGRFVADSKEPITVRVRFLRWDSAFRTIREELVVKPDSNERPDVCQIGTTWRDFFAEKGIPPELQDKGEGVRWIQNKEVDRSLPYIVDVRVMFYWDDLDGDPATSNEPWTSNWKTIIERLKNYIQMAGEGEYHPPMVLPVFRSPDLIHNYIPLIRAGGGEFLTQGSTAVNLTQAGAMNVPLMIHRANVEDTRLFSFPESSHGEVTAAFRRRHYIAMIAQTRTLYDLFQDQRIETRGLFPHRKLQLAVPPAVFKGGSDLIITSSQGKRNLAFKLARFLATEQTHIEELAGVGALPAQREKAGVKAFLAALLPTDQQKQVAFAAVLLAAIEKGEGYAPLASWPTDIESPEVLDKFQSLWRRLGDAQSPDEISRAAKDAELAINRRIDPWTRFTYYLFQHWPFVAVSIGVPVVGVIGVTWRYALRKRRINQQMRNFRFLVAAGIYAADAAHGGVVDLSKYAFHPDAGPPLRSKAHILHTLLLHWQLAQDNKLWEEKPLEYVIWRSILSAIDSRHTGRILEAYLDWIPKGRPDTAADIINFLTEREKVITKDENARAGPNSRLLFFDVRGDNFSPASNPVLVEHVLTCLIQNAFYDGNRFRPVVIRYNSTTIEIENQGKGINSHIIDAVKGSNDLCEFAMAMEAMWTTPPTEGWPGLGIAQAFCVAKQCLGGLEYRQSGQGCEVRTTAVVTL